MAVLREAVTNIGRHAEATAAAVDRHVSDGRCRLQVVDNGHGLRPLSRGGGLGLGNLRRRAEKLDGEFLIERLESGGTELTWDVPLTR